MSNPRESPFGRPVREMHRRSLWQMLGVYVEQADVEVPRGGSPSAEIIYSLW